MSLKSLLAASGHGIPFKIWVDPSFDAKTTASFLEECKSISKDVALVGYFPLHESFMVYIVPEYVDALSEVDAIEYTVISYDGVDFSMLYFVRSSGCANCHWQNLQSK